LIFGNLIFGFGYLLFKIWGLIMFGQSKYFETRDESVPANVLAKKKIKDVEDRLKILANIVGADFGMKVELGKQGGGNYFDPQKNLIVFDPQMLEDGQEYLAQFIAGHEGGHRAITRSLEQVGMPKEKADEFYKKIGFGYANNCLEDCANNNWVGELLPKFKDNCDRVYQQQFTRDNVPMTTPEINALIQQLGFVPKFVSFGSEIIRQWVTGNVGGNLDPVVEKALLSTKDAVVDFYQNIPGVYSNEPKRLQKSKDRYRVYFEKIWPEFEKLVKMDIDEEKLHQLNEQKKLESGESGSEKRDELSEEMKKKLQEMFDALPESEKKKLEELAKENLGKLDDALIKETRGKLSPDNNSPTHEEMKKDEGKNEAAVGWRKQEEVIKSEDRELANNLQKKIEGELSEYDRIYKEIAPLADDFYNRIQQLFLPQRHPRWQKNHPSGQRLDLLKTMQFQADRSLYDKIWERRTIPRKIDYSFTLLVDLSGSMQGKKIEATFRGAILLAEVLNRLGIKLQILGFQDVLIPYKNFTEELTAKKRKSLLTMLREVSNRGNHNKANYNSDGFCLSEASKFLAGQQSKDSFLVVLSDGIPVPDGKHDGSEYELTTVVKDIRKTTKQKLIGIGLGPKTEHVKKYYPTSLPNLALSDLPETLGALLEDMIKNLAKYK